MKRLAGQAGRTVGFLLHHTGMVIMTVFLLLALAVGGFGYRLSLGPMQVPWATSRLANIVSGQGLKIHIARAALAWGGYKSGGTVPLFLQLGEISARNASGVEIASIPHATLVFSPGALFGSEAPILVASSDALFGGSSVPVSLNAAFRLGGWFRFSSAQLFITLGSGTIGIGGFPIAGGSVEVDMTPSDVALVAGKIRLAHVGGSAPVLGVTGAGHRDRMWHGTLTLTADSVRADDLAAYWPPDLVPQTRSWVLGNISAGTANFAKFTAGISAPGSLASVNLESASGSFLASGISVGWIPHAQLITGVAGTFTLVNRDEIDILADTGTLGGITLAAARMRISGLSERDQIGALVIPVRGHVQDAVKLLNAPPLNLLKTAPPGLLQAAGSLTGTVKVTLPLKGNVRLDQVDLDILTNLTNVSAPLPIAGLAFSNGTVALEATEKKISASGTAQLAGEPAHVTTQAIFGPRGADFSASLHTVAGNGLLHRFGLEADPGQNDGVSGVVPIDVAVRQDPAGNGSISLQADLTKAELGAPAVGWSKVAGLGAHVNLAAVMAGGVVTGITELSAVAPDLDISGASDPNDPHRLNLTRLHIRGTEAAGDIVAPAGPGDQWRVDLSGPRLNVTAILNPPPKPNSGVKPASPKPSAPGEPLWSAHLRFATFVMAEHGAPRLRDMVFDGDGQGETVYDAAGTAAGDDGQAVHVRVVHASGLGQAEAVHVDTPDAGYLLRALGAFADLQGGALVMDAKYQLDGDSSGLLTMQKFRLLQAPAFTKVMQGLTLYGIPEATSGPGLMFDRLVAPFAIRANVLTLTGARAFSASLGFTASGTIGLVDGQTDLATTIVPAYALNAFLGKIPVFGRLFSPEKGGGLIAVRAKITGQLMAPKVSVNPLSALTPGFLRDVFGVGQAAKPAS